MADAAVEEHRDSSLHRLYDAGQRVERGHRSIHLPAAVIGDDDAVHSAVHSLPRVLGVQDSFQEDGQFCVLAKEREVLPVERAIREDAGPQTNRSARVLLRGRGQPASEHGIAEKAGHALGPQKGQIGAIQVAGAPAEDGGVQSDDDSGITGAFGASQHARGDFRVARPVELVEPGRVEHGIRHLLDASRCRRAVYEGHAESRGSAGRGQLGLGMQDALHTHRTEQHRSRKANAEQVNADVALGDVAQHARDDAPAAEGFAIGANRVFGACPAGHVIPGFRAQRLARFSFQLLESDGHGGMFAHQAAEVDLRLMLQPVEQRVGRTAHRCLLALPAA